MSSLECTIRNLRVLAHQATDCVVFSRRYLEYIQPLRSILCVQPGKMTLSVRPKQGIQGLILVVLGLRMFWICVCGSTSDQVCLTAGWLLTCSASLQLLLDRHCSGYSVLHRPLWTVKECIAKLPSFCLAMARPCGEA